jgi:DNA polymerase (family 10)
VEVNAHPRRLDLNDHYLRRARELGVKVVVNTDAHSVAGLDVMRFGVDQARRGWLEKEHIVNCRTREDLVTWLGLG